MENGLSRTIFEKRNVLDSCANRVAEDVALDEHRRLVGDGDDEFEVFGLELRERLMPRSLSWVRTAERS